jgi:hypothetical protein
MVPLMLELIFSYILQKNYQGYDSHFLCVAHCNKPLFPTFE